MALLLRSKHLRLLTCLSRRYFYGLHVGPSRPARQCNKKIFSSSIRDFSIKAAIVTSQDTSLDRSLRKLDQGARRAGRISKRELEDVIEELRHSRSATSTQSLLLIRCCGSLVPEEMPETRTQLVQEIWKTLENLGVPMDISHYNALLRVYLENEFSFSPTEFLADLEKKGIEPNRVTYQRLIARYCQEGDMEGATHILEFMRSKQLPVNESVFNALILGHSQTNDMESARGILGVMKQAGLEPSAETYTTLLCGYGKIGDIASINDILQQCEQNDVCLTDRDFMDIIYVLAINGHAQHVDEIINLLTISSGFNHDAVNLILRLVNKKQLDTAKKILLRMPRSTRNGEPVQAGNFFVRQLVKAQCPIEDTVAHCVALEEAGLNSRALLTATETCLQLGQIEYCFGLFSALKSRGFPIRSHYIWPLVATCGNANDADGILNVLKRFQTKFQIQVKGEALRDYAVPHLYRLSSEKNKAFDVIMKLNSAGLSRVSCALSLVFHLLTEKNISEAATISKQFRALYSPSLLRRPLLQAFSRTRDGVSFAIILRQMYDSAGRLAELQSSSSSSSSDDEDMVSDRLEMVGHMVLEAVSSLPRKSPEVVVQLLRGLKDQGLGFSNSIAELLVERLGSESLNTDISDLLEKLTSGDIVPELNNRQSPYYGHMGEDQLLKIIQGGKGERALNAKRQLLSYYCRNKEFEKAENLRKEFEKEGIELSAGHNAQLIDLYVTCNQLDKAVDLYDMCKTKEAFTLDRMKVIKLATLLIKNGRLDDALQCLESQAPTTEIDGVSFMYNTGCRNLLFSLADQGQVDSLNKFFDALVKYNYIDVSNVMLGPLVKVHLERGDLDGAMRQFEQCVNKYQCTPWKNELSCKLIEAEDAAALQKLTDLSTKVHGEVNSLYDLVFAFLECGRVRQARKILETPGLHMRSQRVNTACKRFQTEGKITSLEGLVEATRELPHIDRSDIFQHLLVSYCQNKDTEKALGLWTRMQEEDIQPSDEFLYILGNFLKESGVNVPFAIPDITPPENFENDVVEASSMPSEMNKFINLVQEEKFVDALALRLRFSKEDKFNISRKKNSDLLEGIVINGTLEQVRHLLFDLLENQRFPLNRVFRFTVNKLAAAGDTQTLLDLRKYLDSEHRRVVSYDNKLCQAFTASGQASAYLDDLEKSLGETSDHELLRESFPVGGILGLLEKHPEYLEKIEEIALKYQKCGVDSAMNLLWMHYLITHNFDKADKVWKEYLKPSSQILFRRVLRHAQEKADEDVARSLVTYLKDSTLSSTVIGLAYDCLVNVQLTKNKIDEAFETYLEMDKQNLTGGLHETTLNKLQEAAQQNGRQINLPKKS